MREVAAGRQVHGHDRIAEIQERKVGLHIAAGA